jgi:2'-5' RNA ligase
MGCVAEADVPAVANVLDAIAASHPPLDLTVAGLHARISSPVDATVTSLECVRTPALQALHEAVMRATSGRFRHEAAPQMFIQPASVTDRTLRWVNEYATSASFDRFWPHITLGMGTVPAETRVPKGGTASRLALCHLGPHCTCRGVLFETSLRGG